MAQIERMKAAGPVKRDYPTLSSLELEQVHELMANAAANHVELQSEGMSVTLRRGSRSDGT